MIKIIAYFFALILMIYSLWSAPTHLKTIPCYLRLRLTSPYVLRGLSASLLTILSIIISICTFIKPNLLWLFITLIFIFFNIWSLVYMMRSGFEFIEEIYKEQNKQKNIE
jgi:hypothetical protein